MKKSYLCAFPAVLIWATTTVVVKVILTDMPDMQMLCISSAFAFLFLLLFNIKNGSVRKMRDYTLKNYAVMAALGFSGIFVYSVRSAKRGLRPKKVSGSECFGSVL